MSPERDLIFDHALKTLRNDIAKVYVRAWSRGVKGMEKSLNDKDTLRAALASLEVMRAVVDGFSEPVRAGLALLKWHDQPLSKSVLTTLLAITQRPEDNANRTYAALAGAGIIGVHETGHQYFNPDSYRYGYTYGAQKNQWEDVDPKGLAMSLRGAFAVDARLLEHAPAFAPAPFRGDAVTRQYAITRQRREQHVVADIAALLQALLSVGGIRKLKTGQQGLREADVKKVLAAAKWEAESFDYITTELIGLLTTAGVLSFDEEAHAFVAPEAALAALAGGSTPMLARALICGVAEMSGFGLAPGVPDDINSDLHWLKSGALVLGVLGCLSASASIGFVPLAEMARAVVERLRPLIESNSRGYHNTKTASPTTYAQPVEAALKYHLARWPLFLGLIETGESAAGIEAVRLTDFGHAVIGRASGVIAAHSARAGAGGPVAQAVPEGKAWVVQPNFEIIVVLEEASARQLWTLPRACELLKRGDHTVSYRLTRKSVSEALQSGLTLEALTAVLEAGSRAALPKNVRVELQGWSSARERIAIQQGATLVTRDASGSDPALNGVWDRLIAEGVIEPLNEQTALVRDVARLSAAKIRSAEYTHGVHARDVVVAVSDDGRVRASGALTRWYSEPVLDRWAERGTNEEGHTSWQLNAASVKQAVKAGLQVGDLLRLLRIWSGGDLPRMLTVALGNWSKVRGGTSAPMQAAWCYVCPSRETYNALASSKAFHRLVSATSADTMSFFIAADNIASARAFLQWAGLLAQA
jgi:hypothetical protein